MAMIRRDRRRDLFRRSRAASIRAARPCALPAHSSRQAAPLSEKAGQCRRRLSGCAGVDGQDRAGNVLCLVAQQILDGIGDVVDFGKMMKCTAADDLLTLLAGQIRVISVSRKPGAIALTLMPRRPTSRASDR